MKWTALSLVLLLSACAGVKPSPDVSASLPASEPEKSTSSPAPAAPEKSPAPTPKPTAPVSCKDGQWCYDYLTFPRITKEMVARNPGELCPNYGKAISAPALALSFVGEKADVLAKAVGETAGAVTMVLIPVVDRVKFWLELQKAITLAESGWKVAPKPYLEDTQGIDPVTKLPTYSEGLYQLSYKDKLNYPKDPTCQLIDYAKKNIERPDINVGCAMEIQLRLLANNPKLSVVEALGKYWSSVRPPVYSEKKKRWLHTEARAYLKKAMPECYK